MSWEKKGCVDEGNFLIYKFTNKDTYQHIIEIRQGFISEKHIRLILAAPDLLDALIEITDWYESVTNTIENKHIEKARAAISKAKDL